MCNLLSFVYFSLIIITVIESSDMGHEKVIESALKSSKHNHKTKLPKTNENDILQTNTESTKNYTDIVYDEKKEEFERSGTTHNPDPDKIVDDTETTEDDLPLAIVDGSSTRRMNTDTDENKEDKNGHEIETDHEDVSRSDATYDNDPTQSKEGLIYTPNRKSLSRDVVLDLKARTGHLHSEETNIILPSEESVPNLELTSDHDQNQRTGLFSAEYSDFTKPSFEINNQNRPNILSNKDTLSPFYRSNMRPGMVYNRFPNHYSIIPPPFFNNINSREFYQNPNSYENAWQGNAAKQMNTVQPSYFGFVDLNAQNNQHIREMCANCQGTPPHANTFRRSTDTGTMFETANGRSIEFEPSGENSYPLAPLKDRTGLEELVQFQDTRRRLVSSLEMQPGVDPRNGNYNYDRNNQDTDPISKMLMPLVNTPILLNRRFGLGGIRGFVGK